MDQTTSNYDAWIGRDCYDVDGDKIGEITSIYYDDQSGRPEWVAIKTGLFGANVTFVPINGSSITTDGDLVVRYDKATVKDAPNIDDANAHLSAADEELLYRHYGFDYTSNTVSDWGYGADYETVPRADRDYTFERTGYAQPSVEEVDTEEVTAVTEEPIVETQRTAEKVRLRKYRTTEMRQVPVTREEVRVEREAVDDDKI